MKLAPFYGYLHNDISIIRSSKYSLYDSDEKEYIDMVSSGGVVNIGHNNQKIISFIHNELNKENIIYTYPMYSNKSQMSLVEDLNRITDNVFSTVYRTTGGTESVEVGIQLGLHMKLGGGILFFRNGYHGNSFLLRNMISSSGNTNIFKTKLYENPVFSLGVDIEIHKNGSINGDKLLFDIEKSFNSGRISVFVMEPYLSFSGNVELGHNVLRKIREMCDKYKVILIFDEVVTGFGRLGEWFAYQAYGVVPDIICCAKGLTSGYAQGGCVMSKFSVKESKFSYYSTFAWSGISTNIMRKNIEILELEILNNKAEKYSELWIQLLEDQLPHEKFIVKGKGFLFTIFSYKEFESSELEDFMQKKGFICVFPSHQSIIVCPPLSLTEQEIKFISKTFCQDLISFFG